MQSYTLNRPDGALLCRVLEQHTNDAAGAILRLAWMAGLMRDEIQHLTWAQVDLLGEQLLLPDRAVPLAPELAAWLEALRRERNGSSERVVLSDRDQQPLAAQSISRLARAALDAGDLKAVRLIDLRHDYVLRQLERHDWQYVSRITGLEAAAMNVHFAAYLTEKKVSTRIRRKAAPQIDEFALWKLLQAEQDTPALGSGGPAPPCGCRHGAAGSAGCPPRKEADRRRARPAAGLSGQTQLSGQAAEAAGPGLTPRRRSSPPGPGGRR